MERKIGELFEYNGEWLQCVEQPKKYDKTVCALCAFQGNGNCELDRCSGTYRSDKKFVIFKKLEKVGEPITYMNRTYQRLKSLDDNICKYCYFKNQVCNPQLCGESFFLVGIKKVVEDMGEENDIKPYDKYFSNGTVSNTDNLPKSNLKPFDLEAAKQGKPVCTREGRKARIICFDLQDPEYDMVALILGKNGFESICTFNSNGRFNDADDVDKQSKHDLMMLPEKKEGWVNIVKDTDGSYCCKGEVHSDYNDAILENINVLDKRGITVKIEWYE